LVSFLQLPSTSPTPYPTVNTDLQKFIINNTELKMYTKNTKVLNVEELLNGLNEMIICSDGGADNGKGSFGIVMHTNNQTVLKTYSRIPEVYSDISSHRSESFGIMIAIRLLQLILQYQRIDNSKQKPSINLLCDNKTVVNTINTLRHRKMNIKQQYSPDMDIIRAITIGIKAIAHRIDLKISHIKGHQDKKSSKLNLKAQLNITADELATKGLTTNNVAHTDLPGNNVKITINELQLTTKINEILRETYHGIKLHRHFKETYQWNDNTISTIWWQVHGKSLLQ
jgi:RNase H